MDYKKAGVDISAGEEFVRLIKPQVRQTFTPGVITDIGAFGGFFLPDFSAEILRINFPGREFFFRFERF